MNGSIKDRIMKKGVDKNGKTKENLKVYDVYYRFKDPLTGLLKQASKKGFRTKGEAEDFLLNINTQLADGSFVQRKNKTLGEYLVEWLDTYVETNLRELTIAGYRVNVEKHIIPHLGNIELQNLTSSHIDSFYASKMKDGRLDGKGGLSAKTVLYIHRVLSEALQHAVKKRMISRNVALDVTNTPKPKKFKSGVYDTEEIKLLLQSAKDSQILVPIALAVLCGLRRGELMGLRWSDVNFEEKFLTISRQMLATKDGLKYAPPKSEESSRRIVLSEELIAILKRHREKQEEYKKFFDTEYQDNDLIVANTDGKPIDPRYFSKIFSNHLKKHELRHIRLHDLRHSAASLMLSSGVQMKVASQILGHSSIGITADLYTHVVDDLKKDASEKISSFIFNKTDEKP